MKKLLLTAIGAHLLLSGCAQPPRPQPQSEASVWPAELTMDEARALSPNECKAILITRAALEARSKSEVHARFLVGRQGEDWIVTVMYTASTGYTMPPGSYESVLVGRDWTIKGIMPGA